MSIDPSLYNSYIGPNVAHKAFKGEVVNAKVLFFQIWGTREKLKAYFEEKVIEARRSAPDKFALGMVVEVFSPTQFRVLNIPHNEADLVTQNYDSLEAQFLALLYTDLHRILESFLLDLYAEIARKEPRVLRSSKTVTFEEVLKTSDMVDLLLEKQLIHLSHSDRENLEKQFQDIGLPIIQSTGIPEEEIQFLAREISLLWAIRNVLQHNHGIINDLFLKKLPNSSYATGDYVMIDVQKLGRAFAAVESVGDNLNQRAVPKYGLS